MGDLSFGYNGKRDEEEQLEKSGLVKTCKSHGHLPSEKSPIIFRLLGIIKVYNECQRCHIISEGRPDEVEIDAYKKITRILRKYREYKIRDGRDIPENTQAYTYSKEI